MCNEASTFTINPILFSATYPFFPKGKIFWDAATDCNVMLSDELQPTFQNTFQIASCQLDGRRFFQHDY